MRIERAGGDILSFGQFSSREFLGLSLVRKCFGRPCVRSLSRSQVKRNVPRAFGLTSHDTLARANAGGSLQHLILERHAFRIVLLEPFFRGVFVCEHLEMIGMTNLVSGIDINPNGCHWSLFSFRRPQCVSLRDESNSRTWPRFNALMTPMRANIVGPPNVATRIKASIAACHSAAV